MNRMPSSEFRKTFARITETTVVVVHGHVIGTWTPVGGVPVEAEQQDDRAGRRPAGARAFNSQPFTPVPKPGAGR